MYVWVCLSLSLSLFHSLPMEPPLGLLPGSGNAEETSKELIWDELRHRLSHSAKRRSLATADTYLEVRDVG